MKTAFILVGLLLVIGSSMFSQSANYCLEFLGGEYGSQLGGNNDCISAPNNSSFDLQKSVTMEAWIKTNNATKNQKVLGKTTVAFSGGYMLGIQNGQLYPEVWDISANNYTFSAGSIPSNEWTHIAVSWDGGQYYIGYVNGVEVYKAPVPNNMIGSNTNPFIIGAAPWDQYYFGMDGMIDEVRLWNVPVDSITINEWMHKRINAGHPYAYGLVAYYRLDENSGLTISDATANGNDGTATANLSAYWKNSYLPFASSPSTTLNDVEGIWESWITNNSDEMAVVDSNNTGMAAIAIGNDDGGLGYITSDIPQSAYKRVEKYWRIEKTDTIIDADIMIDISNIDTTGIDTLCLLGSIDNIFSTTDTILFGDIIGNNFVVDDYFLDDSITFYTLASYKYPGPTTNINSFFGLDTCYSSVGFIDLVVTGGSGSYSYLWNTGFNLPFYYNILAGVYTVTITDNVYSNTFYETIIISNIGGIFNGITSVTNSTCSGCSDGSIDMIIGGTGTHQFSWSNGDTTQNISNLLPGIYSVTVTNDYGCDTIIVDTVSYPTILNNNVCIENVYIFPNPSDQYIIVSSYDSFVIELYSTDGILYHRSSDKWIDISYFPPSLYIAIVYDIKGNLRKKVKLIVK